MNFRTQIPFHKQSQQALIDYNSKVLLLGSCFVEHIGGKLVQHKFDVLQNPFGILFHPLAIERVVRKAIHSEQYIEEELFFHNEQWHCFDVHSRLSDTSKMELLQNLNQRIAQTKYWIDNASHIVITLGTAWGYRHIATDTIVANCHKVPQKQFRKEILSVDAVYESLDSILALIKNYNPESKIIFTVSPVRHLKDGFVENTQSKAHLIAAIHQIIDEKRTYYFPSYELLMDELRDYRFYAKDMIHPNEIAVDYIWEQFQRVWISDEVMPIMKMIIEIDKGQKHKPFNPNSKAHQDFLDKLEAKKQAVLKKIPHLKF